MGERNKGRIEKWEVESYGEREKEKKRGRESKRGKDKRKKTCEAIIGWEDIAQNRGQKMKN